MKPLNLLTLKAVYLLDDRNLMTRFLSINDCNIKESEIIDYIKFIIGLENNSTGNKSYLFDGYYVGFSIKHISKEFDLLRFGDEEIINIEIKKRSSLDRVEDQLIQNRYYLKFLEKDIRLFSFIVEDNKLYELTKSNKLVEVDMTVLVGILSNNNASDVLNIQDLFDIGNYLVSPFNQPEKYVAGEYFLTSNQMEVKSKIIKVLNLNTTESNIIGIEGNPGTGKTLLIYDIYRALAEKDKKPLIIHCANLNEGQLLLANKFKFKITSIKNISATIIHKLNEFDVIIIDEAQRIRKYQLELIFNYCIVNNMSIIFSYDPKQCLSLDEKMSNFKEFLDNKTDLKYTLSNKIRINDEISQFIICLFDLKKIQPNLKVKDMTKYVSFNYFNNREKCNEYIKSLEYYGWVIIHYTTSIYNDEDIKVYTTVSDLNAHNVIGQEYDKVVAIIDENFFYDINNELQAIKKYYDLNGMLFQIATRSRKQLKVVIVNNIKILNSVISILEQYS